MDAASFEVARELHKPQTPEGVRAAILDMIHNGLAPSDIAHVLRLDIHVVRGLLWHCEDCE